jgi:hypothetical protein
MVEYMIPEALTLHHPHLSNDNKNGIGISSLREIAGIKNDNG